VLEASTQRGVRGRIIRDKPKAQCKEAASNLGPLGMRQACPLIVPYVVIVKLNRDKTYLSRNCYHFVPTTGIPFSEIFAQQVEQRKQIIFNHCVVISIAGKETIFLSRMSTT
jgi:hypothetical protein